MIRQAILPILSSQTSKYFQVMFGLKGTDERGDRTSVKRKKGRLSFPFTVFSPRSLSSFGQLPFLFSVYNTILLSKQHHESRRTSRTWMFVTKKRHRARSTGLRLLRLCRGVGRFFVVLLCFLSVSLFSLSYSFVGIKRYVVRQLQRFNNKLKACSLAALSEDVQRRIASLISWGICGLAMHWAHYKRI